MTPLISETGCWLSADLVNSHYFDKGLAEAIVKECHPIDSIIDIGCGNGAYVNYFTSKGFLSVGYDGSPLTEQITDGACHQMDFSTPQGFFNWDVVVSLEVGEHIPVQYEQIFLDNIVRPTPRLIILSWAIEGQSGQGHVNCRNNDYIIAEMEKRAYSYLPAASHRLRSASRLPWFKKTIMVFDEMPF